MAEAPVFKNHIPRAALHLTRFSEFIRIQKNCEYRQGDRCVHPESNGVECCWESCSILGGGQKNEGFSAH
ncbi:hypothetical protein ES703_84579 [subsurface metagenome]